MGKCESTIEKERQIMIEDKPLIQKGILSRLEYVDGYATRAIAVIITGPEMCLYEKNLDKIKILLLMRLDAAYQKLKKEIEEA